MFQSLDACCCHDSNSDNFLYEKQFVVNHLFKKKLFLFAYSLFFFKKIVTLQYIQPKSCVIMDNATPLNRIKVMLAERMMSRNKLFEMLGYDPAIVSKWVTNTSLPSLKKLIKIARCLRCEIKIITNRVLHSYILYKPIIYT